MPREPQPKRLSDAAQAAIVTGVFGVLALILTQWKDMPWNSRAETPSAAASNEKAAAAPTRAEGDLPGNAAGTTEIESGSKPAVAQPRDGWVVPARFLINQDGCANPVEVIGTWDNGVELSGGTATARCGNDATIRGHATGRLKESYLKLTIEWDQDTIGVYEGAVDEEGHVTGTSYSPKNRDWGRPAWHSAAPLRRG